MTTAQRALLEAVEELHRRGYEGLRATPYLYATGHWRCELSVVGQPYRGVDKIFGYSEAQEWQGLGGPENREATPIQIADALERLPALQATRFACPAYRVWYSVLLQVTAPAALPYLFSDSGYDAVKAGAVHYSRLGPDQKWTTGEFPLAPVF